MFENVRSSCCMDISSDLHHLFLFGYQPAMQIDVNAAYVRFCVESRGASSRFQRRIIPAHRGMEKGTAVCHGMLECWLALGWR